MNFTGKLRTVWHATFAPIRGATHAERLEDYYRGQASDYDAFRQHLLHGREELIEVLPVPEGARLVELGAGTGGNLEALGEKRQRCSHVELVDLCPSLLRVAEERVRRHGWKNVTLHQADAATYVPVGGPVDVVLLSYALTMMPDWFLVVDRAWEMLRPGGVIGVTDFYVSRKHPEMGLRRHAWWQRVLWPWCFHGHNVFLSPDHLAYLLWRFERVYLSEKQGPMPFMMGLQPPYYVLIGRKGGAAREAQRNCPPKACGPSL
jgi:S-adenosylmethionine-diacylgycerolhomoserine-N-methlytransferase